jgi:hypothetical protein
MVVSAIAPSIQLAMPIAPNPIIFASPSGLLLGT